MQNSYRTHSHYYQIIKHPAWWRSVLLCKNVAGRRTWFKSSLGPFYVELTVNESYCFWYIHCCVQWLASATVT